MPQVNVNLYMALAKIHRKKLNFDFSKRVKLINANYRL